MYLEGFSKKYKICIFIVQVLDKFCVIQKVENKTKYQSSKQIN